MSARMSLTVLGSGDPFGSGGRNQSGYLIEAGRVRMLLDCGVTTLIALRRFGIDPAGLNLVLLSHLHGDHAAGLPFLYHYYRHVEPPASALRVWGPPGVKQRIEAIRGVIFPPRRKGEKRFGVRYASLTPGKAYRPAGRAGPEIAPFRVRHQEGHVNYGYRIRWRGRELAYSGDTGWFPGLPAEVEGADLFLCECTHLRGDSPKHLSLEELAGHRREFKVGAWLLTHLGPGLGGRRRRGGFPLAQDGLKIRV